MQVLDLMPEHLALCLLKQALNLLQRLAQSPASHDRELSHCRAGAQAAGVDRGRIHVAFIAIVVIVAVNAIKLNVSGIHLVWELGVLARVLVMLIERSVWMMAITMPGGR